MSNYECPDCGGGFPEVPPERECPWCGHPMNGQKERGVFDPAQSQIPALTYDSDVTPDTDTPAVDLSTGNSGTTTCPECGDPMPMVTWTGPEKPECRKCRRNNRSPIGGNTE